MSKRIKLKHRDFTFLKEDVGVLNNLKTTVYISQTWNKGRLAIVINPEEADG